MLGQHKEAYKVIKLQGPSHHSLKIDEIILGLNFFAPSLVRAYFRISTPSLLFVRFLNALFVSQIEKKILKCQRPSYIFYGLAIVPELQIIGQNKSWKNEEKD